MTSERRFAGRDATGRDTGFLANDNTPGFVPSEWARLA